MADLPASWKEGRASAETNGQAHDDDSDRIDSLTKDEHAAAPALPVPIDWAALFARPVNEEDWLVADLWPRGRMISLSAPAKARKSLLMLYLAARLAVGRCPWTGAARPPRRVVYLDFEMTEDDLLERLDDMGFGADDLTNLRYFLRPEMPNLDTPEGGKLLLAVLDAHEAEALIIDTFSRVVSTVDWGGNEVREFYRWSAAHVKSRGISIGRLDHTGHAIQTRAAGSHAKGADVDVGWVIRKGDHDGLILEHHGMSRVRWVPPKVELFMDDDPLAFRLAAHVWPPGTRDVATDLDHLVLPLDVTVKDAQHALQQLGRGRNRSLVREALKYRRDPK